MTSFAKPYNVVFDTLNMPVVTDWSDHFHNVYLSPHTDYQAYIDSMRDLNVLAATQEQIIERIINLCVEGAFQEALTNLMSLNYSDWTAIRRIAYFRLCGCLERQLGAADRARRSYETALAISQEIDDAASSNWIIRALRFDIFQMIAEGHGANWDWVEQENASIRAIDAWFGNPPFDSALNSSSKEHINESFQEFYKGERSRRWRGGMPRELAWFNASLAIAYLTGDFISAKKARLLYSKQEAISATRTDDNFGLSLVVNELIRAHSTKDLEQFLRVMAYRVQAHIKIDHLVLTLRPIEPSGLAASPIYDTVLSLIEYMADYISDEAKQLLKNEMFTEALNFLSGADSYFVRPPHRTEGKFIRAFKQVGPLNDEQVDELVEILKLQNNSNYPETFWEVLINHEWSKNESSEDIAVRTFEAIQVVTASSVQNAAELSLTNAYLQILSKIADSFGHIGEVIDGWLLSGQSQINIQEGWWYFLNRHHAQASTLVRARTEAMVNASTEYMTNVRPGDSVSFPTPYPISRLPYVYRHYPEIFSEQERQVQLVLLLDASRNTSLDTETKGAVLDAAADAIKFIDDKSVVLGGLRDRTSMTEQARQIDSSLFGFWVNETTVKLLLLKLKIEAGYEPSILDFNLLIESSLSKTNDVVMTAIDVIETCISLNLWLEQLSSTLLNLLHHDVYTIRAAAAFTSIESQIFLESSLQSLGFQTVLELMSGGHPYIIQTIMSSLSRNIHVIPQRWQEEILGQAELNLSSSHSGIRHYAKELLEARSRYSPSTT